MDEDQAPDQAIALSQEHRRQIARGARGAGADAGRHRQPHARADAPSRGDRERRLRRHAVADLRDRFRQGLCARGRARRKGDRGGGAQQPASAAGAARPITKRISRATPSGCRRAGLAMVAGAIGVLVLIARGHLVRHQPVPRIGGAGRRARPKTPSPPRPKRRRRRSSGGQVSLTATDSVWLKIYDATGKTLFEKTMARRRALRRARPMPTIR